MDHGGGLADEERSLQSDDSAICQIARAMTWQTYVGWILRLHAYRQSTLRGQLLDLGLLVLLPVHDEGCLADSERSSGLYEPGSAQLIPPDCQMAHTKMIVRMVSLSPAVMTASWCFREAPASSAQMNRVPTQTPVAP